MWWGIFEFVMPAKVGMTKYLRVILRNRAMLTADSYQTWPPNRINLTGLNRRLWKALHKGWDSTASFSSALPESRH